MRGRDAFATPAGAGVTFQEGFLRTSTTQPSTGSDWDITVIRIRNW